MGLRRVLDMTEVTQHIYTRVGLRVCLWCICVFIGMCWLCVCVQVDCVVCVCRCVMHVSVCRYVH